MTRFNWNSNGDRVKPAQNLLGSGLISSRAENLKFFTRLTKKMKSSALARGSPRHILLPWPKGTKYSGLKNFPSASRNLTKRRVEVGKSILV